MSWWNYTDAESDGKRCAEATSVLSAAEPGTREGSHLPRQAG